MNDATTTRQLWTFFTIYKERTPSRAGYKGSTPRCRKFRLKISTSRSSSLEQSLSLPWFGGGSVRRRVCAGQNFSTWLEECCQRDQCGKVPGGLVRPLSRSGPNTSGKCRGRACHVRRSGRFGRPDLGQLQVRFGPKPGGGEGGEL